MVWEIILGVATIVGLIAGLIAIYTVIWKVIIRRNKIFKFFKSLIPNLKKYLRKDDSLKMIAFVETNIFTKPNKEVALMFEGNMALNKIKCKIIIIKSDNKKVKSDSTAINLIQAKNVGVGYVYTGIVENDIGAEKYTTMCIKCKSGRNKYPKTINLLKLDWTFDEKCSMSEDLKKSVTSIKIMSAIANKSYTRVNLGNDKN